MRYRLFATFVAASLLGASLTQAATLAPEQRFKTLGNFSAKKTGRPARDISGLACMPTCDGADHTAHSRPGWARHCAHGSTGGGSTHGSAQPGSDGVCTRFVGQGVTVGLVVFRHENLRLVNSDFIVRSESGPAGRPMENMPVGRCPHGTPAQRVAFGHHPAPLAERVNSLSY